MECNYTGKTDLQYDTFALFELGRDSMKAKQKLGTGNFGTDNLSIASISDVAPNCYYVRRH